MKARQNMTSSTILPVKRWTTLCVAAVRYSGGGIGGGLLITAKITAVKQPYSYRNTSLSPSFTRLSRKPFSLRLAAFLF